jgi:hypothetical protein
VAVILLLVAGGPWALLGVGGDGGDEWRYSVVIDAGSSGSRVYIYKVHVRRPLLPTLLSRSLTRYDNLLAITAEPS